MPKYINLLYSKKQVDNAGELIRAHISGVMVSNSELDHAYAVLNNWRGSHAFPLNTIQMYLRKKANDLSTSSLVAQRLKRVPSIINKLERFDKMQLGRMQDIGGCRAIMPDVSGVYKLLNGFKGSKIKHILSNEKDYINDPKESGYRGIHLIYKYKSKAKPQYNGLQVEVQIRSKLQHAWATAVETVGLFTKQSLKSSRGSEDWLRFFSLVSNAFAVMEKTAIVPGCPSNKDDLHDEITTQVSGLNVLPRMRKFSSALKVLNENGDSKKFKYYLMYLDADADRLRIMGYTAGFIEKANEEYLKLEREFGGQLGKDVVLVSVDSVDNLTAAYPNYFLDTDLFVKYLQEYRSQRSV
jgi:ppGpp synthetase/RelA/SpoT-type nucleotidyltranferase